MSCLVELPLAAGHALGGFRGNFVIKCGNCVRLTVFPAEEKLTLWVADHGNARDPFLWKRPLTLLVPGLATKAYRLFVVLKGATVVMVPDNVLEHEPGGRVMDELDPSVTKSLPAPIT
jgi:hypothetical protein